MSLREIPEAEWEPFLEQFSVDHRAWLASVDRIHPGAVGHVEASERPLRSVTPEFSARRVVRINVRFQEDSQARHSIQIDAPRTLRVDETAAGVARGLEIQDQDGDWLRIRFRVAPPADMLDGVAPGEL
jgi:hypothetical protein